MLKDYFIRRELIKGLSKALDTTVDMTIYTENVITNTQELLYSLCRDVAWNNTLRNMETLMEININPHTLRSEQSTPEEWTEAQDTARKLTALPIMIDDSSSMSIDSIRAQTCFLKSCRKCDIIFIDYLQLGDIKNHSKENRNREQEVAIAARKAKLLAKEMNYPVVLLSQLNREAENRFAGRPQLSDLRESGTIEQNADIVLLLHRPALYKVVTDKESGYPTEGLGILSIAKHRNGETGNVYFSHNKSITKIADYVPPME